MDTSAYARLRAHDHFAIEILAEKTPVIVPATVIGELEAGFRGGARQRENEVTLEEFLAEPFVQFLPISRSIASRYGEIFSELRSAGTPIPTNDIWIAAAAREVSAPVLTADGHFSKVRGLGVISLV